MAVYRRPWRRVVSRGRWIGTKPPVTVAVPSGVVTVAASAPSISFAANPPSGKITVAAVAPGITSFVVETVTVNTGGGGGIVYRETVKVDDEESLVAVLAASVLARPRIRVTTGREVLSGRD